jgi:hypothetical protein
MYLLFVDSITFFTYLGLAILSLVIFALLIRWAVRADSIVKNQQAMIWFMILQCKKQGATDQEIQNIKDHFGI